MRRAKTSTATKQLRRLTARGVHRISADVPIDVYNQLKVMAVKKGRDWSISRLMATLAIAYMANVNKAKERIEAKKGKGE